MEQDIAVMGGGNGSAAGPFRHLDTGDTICADRNAGIARGEARKPPVAPFGL